MRLHDGRRPRWPAVLARPLAWMLVLAMLLAMPPLALAAAAPRIGVMTMQPGEVFFERFGHDAIVVVDPDSGEAVSYNFGFFDPSEPDFLSRFIRGEMMYHLVALPATQDLAQYQAAGRGVSMQWLDLEPEQARALAALLAERARPENSRYRYDYFTANCATQVRDALDTAMGGALKAQLAGRSRGNTYRSEAVRLASPAPWMWLGFDLGLGPYADRALSRWEEAFVPMRLADSLREARNRQGRPLVQSEQELLPHLIAPEPVEAPRRWWPWLLAGLSLATAIFAARPVLACSPDSRCRCGCCADWPARCWSSCGASPRTRRAGPTATCSCSARCACCCCRERSPCCAGAYPGGCSARCCGRWPRSRCSAGSCSG